MKKILTFAAVGLLVFASSVRLYARDLPEIRIVDVEGSKVANVERDNLIRITGSGVSGGTVTVKITGVGKLESTSNIKKIKDGQVMIGALIKEFVIKPTGTGVIKATVTRKSPSGDTSTEDYEITIN